MKYEYIILNFPINEFQESQDWLNRKGELGFKVINQHFYELDGIENVRITLEKEIND